MKNKEVTSLIQLQEYSKGSVVELPSFAEDQAFTARLRRPSMMALVKNGKIPNGLLVAANELFAKGTQGFNEDNEKAMNDMFEIMDVLCEASFVEPTFQQIKDAGIELTDEQYMFVFQYSQAGVKALESFRQE